MDPKREAQLVEFLRTVPDKYLTAEHNRRIAAKRKPRQPGRRVLRCCDFCPTWLGAQEMRNHVREAHPGGRRKHPPLPRKPRKPPVAPPPSYHSPSGKGA
jgi:hypothetical protein